MIKKRIIGIFLFIIIFLSGCGRAFMADYLFSSDDEDFSKILTDFLSAADENDKEAIKKMFAENVKNKDDFDKKLDDFLKFYKANARSSDFDRNDILTRTQGIQDKGYWCLDADLMLKKGKEDFFIYMKVVTSDKNNPKNQGIHIIDLATKNAYEDGYFLWHSKDGIYVQKEACEDYKTMILYGNRREYEPVDRKLSVDFFRNFIRESTDYKKLLNEIGKANGEVLEDENVFEIRQGVSEKTYVICYVSGDEIIKMEVVNEDKRLETIYSKDGKSD